MSIFLLASCNSYGSAGFKSDSTYLTSSKNACFSYSEIGSLSDKKLSDILKNFLDKTILSGPAKSLKELILSRGQLYAKLLIPLVRN